MKGFTINSFPKSEFEKRIITIRNLIDMHKADLLIVYGDDYRSENIRYLSDCWPIFFATFLVVGLKKDPILLVAAESFPYIKEMSIWDDIRLLREIGM